VGLADESDAESLVGSASDSSAGSEHSTVAPAPAPATKGGGRGRGKGRGHGVPAPAAAAAPAKGRGRGRGGVAVAAKQSKYTWVNLEDHTFTPRTAFSGPDKPSLGEEYDLLKSASPPEEWFKMRDAPDQEYHDRANNSERYRSIRHAKGLDGNTKDGRNKKCYGKAAEITYADMRYLDAYVLLSGLDPAISTWCGKGVWSVEGWRGAPVPRYTAVPKVLSIVKSHIKSFMYIKIAYSPANSRTQ
jgi:hypothetical protein